MLITEVNTLVKRGIQSTMVCIFLQLNAGLVEGEAYKRPLLSSHDKALRAIQDKAQVKCIFRFITLDRKCKSKDIFLLIYY